MATDNIKKTGTNNAYKNDSAGATLITEPVIGIVKNNVDPTHSGRIFVYVSTFGGTDPNIKDNWIPVRYMSPFMGVVAPNDDAANGPDKTGNGKFVGNPQSYGFWASSPDIGTEVVCIFINGRADQGYYIGCIPQPGLIQMTPAIGSSSKVVPNDTEATTYGGADRLPTSEVNYSNPSIRKSAEIYNEPKPVHSYQASILSQQGVIRDNVRGVISSSAQRESPSRVFGMSTPGGPIFEGGYTAATIASAVKTSDVSKLQIIGRTGGHSFVMDDGTLEGQDQLVRLRSSAGHQITMSDSGQTLFIMHSNGQSWVELGKEGTIDIFSTNSFNVRTQGDINLHADRDVNINAKKNLNLYGENVNIESGKNIKQRAGENYQSSTAGTHTVKSDGSMSLATAGEGSYNSSGVMYVNGSKVNLNTGSASLAPETVAPMIQTNHIDTTFSQTVGWMNPSADPLVSVTSRAPTHQPWVGSGKGVNVTVSSVATPTDQQTTPAVEAANNSTPGSPETPQNSAQVSSVPAATTGAGPATAATVTAVTGQIAVNAQALTTAQQQTDGVINTATGMTANIAERAGAIKPGSSILATKKIQSGIEPSDALVGLVTGATGASNPLTLATNVVAQAQIIQTVVSGSAQTLVNSGILTGKESPAQAGGVVTAAAVHGAAAVTSALSGATNITTISNTIASGKFAGSIADSVGAGINGLKTSLSGLTAGITGKFSGIGIGITGIVDNLKSGLQNAFSSVEKSFTALKGGIPNVLGKAQPDSPESDSVKSANSYESAKAEVASAEEALLSAKRDYRNSATAENYAALQTAEQTLSQANQSVAKASTSFLKSSVGGFSLPTSLGGLTPANSTVATSATTLTSGMNSLPGGVASVVAVVNGANKQNPLTSVIGTVTSNPVGAVLATPIKLAGDLVGKTTAVLKGALNTTLGVSTALLDPTKAGVSGIMAKLEAGFEGIASGQVKSAAAAVNTFDKTALVAKTGQLLGDPKIPAPVFNDSVEPSADADAIVAEQSRAVSAVEEAQAKVNQASLNFGIAQEQQDSAMVEAAQETLTVAQAELDTAQTAYATSVGA